MKRDPRRKETMPQLWPTHAVTTPLYAKAWALTESRPSSSDTVEEAVVELNLRQVVVWQSSLWHRSVSHPSPVTMPTLSGRPAQGCPPGHQTIRQMSFPAATSAEVTETIRRAPARPIDSRQSFVVRLASVVDGRIQVNAELQRSMAYSDSSRGRWVCGRC